MWSQAASTFADDVGLAFNFTMAVGFFFLVTITLFMFYCMVKFYHKRHPNPSTNDGSVLLEVIWTVIPTILVVVMFYLGYLAYANIRNIPANAMKVKVTAGKWYWKYKYENGVEQSDKQGLRVPINTPIELDMISNDVIHSFSIPAFRVKWDVLPGINGRENNKMWFEATKNGEFEIFCAEYCGLDHSRMMSKVVVLPKPEFEKWYAAAGEGVAAAADDNPGEKLYNSKGCFACHSTDGSKKVGPTFKGLWGKTHKVVTGGTERNQIVDEAYFIKSLKQPMEDVVKGFPPAMPPQNLSAEETKQIIEFVKSIK